MFRGIIPRSRLTSGGAVDSTHQYATEDTPAVMSRGDSLSSLEFDQESTAASATTKGRRTKFHLWGHRFEFILNKTLLG